MIKTGYKITGFADEIADDLVTQVESLKKLGIHYMEMRGVDGENLIFHSDEKISEIKKYLDDNGIILSALGSPLGKIDINDNFQEHFETFKRAIDIAHKMDCKNIRLFSFYILEGKSPLEFEEIVFQRMGKFVEYACANDVVLLHENEKGIYGEKANECKKLMDAFYGVNFQGIFDFANFVQAGENTWEAYKQLKQYIAYIHIKDAKYKTGSVVPAGYGDGNIEDILTDLFQSGFDGFLSLEPHLFDFSGYALLEKEGISIQNSNQNVLSGMEAFTLAHDSLLKILHHKI